MIGVTQSGVDAYQQDAPPEGYTGSHLVNHPAVDFLLSNGVSWDEAYRIVSGKARTNWNP